ncbi:hypothetical protein [Thermoflavimicrobium daqui]|uniref:Uncharacterized protein n=1 Tax=Thermoflavimicrobium daqui TaxID=2137476 RepID=A0A364K1H3_9BACL|nr:hypothetical protein [Thermoflavimicrobium daqui]RAL21888.1 hypothetical protein DL897_15845 [Thermoflavimicrobium daqui]
MNKKFILSAIITIAIEAVLSFIISIWLDYTFLEITFFIGFICTGILFIAIKPQAITRLFKGKRVKEDVKPVPLKHNGIYIGSVLYLILSFIAIFTSYLLWTP